MKSKTGKPEEYFLVIEDDNSLRELVIKTLSRSGVKAVGCATGAQALERIAASVPAAILLDQSLPDMTGREIIAALSADGMVIPFIVMTGQGDERLAVEMMKLGASDYLTKDADFLDILPVAVLRLQDAIKTKQALDEAQDALLESEEMQRKILQTVPDLIIRSDLEGTITFVNEMAFPGLDYLPRETICGKNLFSFFAGDDQLRAMKNARTRLQKDIGPQVYQLRFDEGTILDAEVNGAVIHDKESRPVGMVYVIRDITERKRAEAEREKLQSQLLQAQKMESVGILAGGVAHDFNNLLHTMHGNIELLLQGKPEDHPDARRLRVVTSSMDRAAQLVQQLLFFSRKAEFKRMRINVNQEVDGMARILERTIPKMIDLHLHLDPVAGPVSGDPVQIQQVLLNLAGNAVDAMPDGGRLTIATANVLVDEGFVRAHPGSNSGRHVLLTVSDTGCGMDREIMDHVFDPFFTTKEVDKGTGLGLASVYGIVKAHGGYIQCYSEPGLGSTFRVYLPAVEQGDVAQVERMPEPSLQGGSETIMVVDDEPEIRELTREALEMLGYSVKVAANGEQALDIYGEYGQSIDLVLLDLNMPGMGGRKCLQELLQLDPAVKVVIASGYAASNHEQDILLCGAKGFMGKPYQLKELAAVVRGGLDKETQVRKSV